MICSQGAPRLVILAPDSDRDRQIELRQDCMMVGRSGTRAASVSSTPGGEMAIAGTPSVQGFEWSPTPGSVPAIPGENGWCMRDAVCQLFGWRPGSEEWPRFIEAPTGRDLIRLAMHLGLTVFEVGAPGSWDELSRRAAHPGVAMFFFPGTWRAHTAYVPDAQWLLRYWPAPDGRPNRQPPRDTGWPLDKRYMDRSPVLFAVFIDELRPPHEL